MKKVRTHRSRVEELVTVLIGKEELYGKDIAKIINSRGWGADVTEICNIITDNKTYFQINSSVKPRKYQVSAAGQDLAKSVKTLAPYQQHKRKAANKHVHELTDRALTILPVKKHKTHKHEHETEIIASNRVVTNNNRVNVNVSVDHKALLALLQSLKLEEI